MLNLNLTIKKKSFIALIAALTCFTFNLHHFAGFNENAEAVDQHQGPDLVIEEIRSDPARPLSGDMVDVLVTVLNQGAGEARPGIMIGAQRGVGEGYNLSGVIEGGLGPGERGTVNVGRWRVIARQDINGRWTHNELEVKVDNGNFIHEFNENNNISFAHFDVQQPQENTPDLTIYSVRLMPADRERSQEGYYEVGREEQLDIAVTIMNNHIVREGVGDVVVRVSDGSGWESSQTVRMGAAAGGGVNVTLRLNTAEIDTRERELRVIVDPDNRIAEVNENNNGHQYPIRVKKTDIESDELVQRQNIPDLVIEEIRSDPPRPLSGDMVDVLITVLNQGAGEARPGIMIGAQRGVGEGYNLSGVIEGGLGPGERGTVNVGRWRVIARQDINGRWTHNELEAKVDDGNFIHEFNEYNNISFANFNVQQPQDNILDPAEAQPAQKLKRTSSRVTLLQVRSISPSNVSTNPFDFTEVASDVSAAQQPGNNQYPASGEQYPITLTTTFTSLLMVMPGNSVYLPIESGGIGTNTLGDFTLSSGAGTALLIANSFDIPTLQNQVSFFAKEGWTIVSQSIANPVPFEDVALVLKRNSDNYYFKITTKIYASASAMDVFTLSGYNCGPNQADCP